MPLQVSICLFFSSFTVNLFPILSRSLFHFLDWDPIKSVIDWKGRGWQGYGWQFRIFDYGYCGDPLTNIPQIMDCYRVEIFKVEKLKVFELNLWKGQHYKSENTFLIHQSLISRENWHFQTPFSWHGNNQSVFATERC